MDRKHGKEVLALLALVTVLGGTVAPAAAYVPVRDDPAPSSAAPSQAAQTATASVPAAYGGGLIVFASGRDQDGSGAISQIYAMDADGSNQRNLGHSAYDDSAPVLSPDGRKIAFLRCMSGRNTCATEGSGNVDVWLMDADGGNQAALTATAYAENTLSWSPDGTKLVTSYSDAGQWQLVLLPVDGSAATVVVQSASSLGQPDWSPDGSQIAFFWNRTDNPGIYLVAPAASATPTYTNIGAQYPRWSPDGTKLAWVAYPSVEPAQAYIGVSAPAFPSTGPGPYTIVTPGGKSSIGYARDTHPRWSPDGKRILFDSNLRGSGYHQLYVTMADGSTQANYLNLSASEADDWLPDWRAAGIAVPPAVAPPYLAYQDGGLDAPAIKLYDGRTRQTTTLVTGRDLRLAGMWGPWVTYQKGNAYGGYDVYVYDVKAATATRLSMSNAILNQNRPVMDGPRVMWRQTSDDSDPSTSIVGRFYLRDLSANSTSNSPLSVGSSSYGPRYSRYAAGDGRLALVDEDRQVRLYDVDAATTTELAASPDLVFGVQGNLVAAGEHDSQAGGLLVTYTISPTGRTLITDTLAGPAQFVGETLTWSDGTTLYRRDPFEGEAVQVATTPYAGGQSGEVIAWLDAAGSWQPSQAQSLDYYMAPEVTGSITSTLPVTTSIEAMSAADTTDPVGGIWLARVVRCTGLYRAYHTNKAFAIYTTYDPGELLYPREELVTMSGGSATLQFRDGNLVDVGPGVYLRLFPKEITTAKQIEAILNNTFTLHDLLGFKMAVEKYIKDGNTSGIGPDGQPVGSNLTIVANDMTAVSDSAGVLAQAARNAASTLYEAKGLKVPTYLSTIIPALDRTAGHAARLTKIVNVVQAVLSAGRLINYKWYEDALVGAFREYLDNIAGRAVRNPSTGQLMYYPLEPESPTYLNRADVLYKMVMDDGRTCFQEHNWRIVFYEDESLGLWSEGCGVFTWSRQEVARHIARADGEVLRTKLLYPLIQNSLQAYQDAIGIFVPSEAQIILSAMTPGHPVQRWTISKGRISEMRDIDRLRPRNPLKVDLPGASVIFWGTGFTAAANADGSGSLSVIDGMPVVSNLSTSHPDSWGVTATDGTIALAAPPGDAALSIPGRTNGRQPIVVSLEPNETMTALSSNGAFRYQVTFSRSMDTNSVGTYGTLSVATTAGAPALATTRLGALGGTWDEAGATLTITPTAALPAGSYNLTLTLPETVVSSEGLSVAGSPTFTTTFAVVDPVGAGGGTMTTPAGVRLQIPAGALDGPTPIQIQATRAFSVTDGWIPADGLGYILTPRGQTFQQPVRLTVPIDSPEKGDSDIFLWNGEAWEPLHATPSADGHSLTALLDHFSIYGAFQTVKTRVYLPCTVKH